MGGAQGKRAVVTGAASGIGFAVVERLLAEGASVLAVDVNEAGMAPLSGAGAETLVASVAEPADRDRVAEAAGAFDYLVNSAGVLFVKPIWDVTLDEWRNLYAVNVEGTFFIIQRLGRQMRRGGAVLNLSSSSAKLASTVEVTPYSSSKATILGITRSFAYVLAKDGIRVNAILPGHRRHADAGQGARGGRAAARAPPPRRSTRRASSSCRSVAPRRPRSAPGRSGGCSPTRPAT